MILQAPLPPLAFTERWSVVRPAKGFDRGFSETAVLGPRLYFIEETGRNRGSYGALDLATGRRLWSRPTDLDTTHYLTVTPRYLVIAEQNRIRVFSPKDGRPLWSTPRQGFGAGPLLVGDRLLAELRFNTLAAYDLKAHGPAWQKTFPSRVYTKTGFDRLTLVGDSLWFADPRGLIRRLDAQTGRTLWSLPFTGGEVVDIVPTAHGVAVFGNRAIETWRSTDGARLWRATEGVGWNDGFYQKSPDQLWTVPQDGRLHRLDARTGRALPAVLVRESEPTFEPVPYRGGLLVLGSGPVVRVDAAGRPVGAFDPQMGIHELWPVGDDLIVNDVDRIVRLRPGTPPAPTNPAAFAARLVAKPVLTPEDRRAILRLGRAALPALFAALPKAKDDRLETLGLLLTSIADARDTGRVFALADAEGLFAGRDLYPEPYRGWLLTKADPNLVALKLLPRLRTAREPRPLGSLLAFSVNATADPVVNELLGRLRDPKTPGYLKSLIYGSIARSGRPDALASVDILRAESRRLERPIPGFSTEKDADGNGLPDAVDANPLVAPHALTEVQQVLLTVFDARFRFEERNDRIALVDYGPGVAPFELLGWRGGLVPEPRAAELGLKQTVPSRSYKYPFIRFGSRSEGPPVTFNADHTGATAEVGVTYGGLDGTGYLASLKKLHGRWYVVSLTMTWIS